MSKNNLSTFAVAGVGGLGRFIAEELVNEGVTVVALTRGGNDKIPAGVTERAVDYANPQSIEDALKGVEVVVSALAGPGFSVQTVLADAAKKAGAKLFVPSEFGVRTPEIQWGLMLFKPQLQEHLRQIGLPYTLFFNGSFSDLGPRFGMDVANKTAFIVGAGTSLVSWTTRPDIGRFVAYILTHLPIKRLEGGVFGVEGSRHTLLESLAIIEKAKLGGEKFKVAHRDVADVKSVVGEKGLAAIGDYLSILTEDGLCCVEGHDATQLVPNLKPLTLEEAIAKYW